MSLLDYVKNDSRDESADPEDAATECRKPSRLWYVAHVPFGFASGPACHLIWEDKNQDEAVKHLGYGVMLSVGTWISVGVTMLVSFA